MNGKKTLKNSQRKKDEDESRFLIENVASKKIVEQCH